MNCLRYGITAEAKLEVCVEETGDAYFGDPETRATPTFQHLMSPWPDPRGYRFSNVHEINATAALSLKVVAVANV